jgi:quinol monooxygenase YgiN
LVCASTCQAVLLTFKDTPKSKNMLVVVYAFDVKPGKEAEFITAWTALTELFYTHAGSLGSSLHRETSERFIAYAQWPDESFRDAADDKMPASSADLYATMRKCCTEIKVAHQLDLLVDLRRKQPYSPSQSLV